MTTTYNNKAKWISVTITQDPTTQHWMLKITAFGIINVSFDINDFINSINK